MNYCLGCSEQRKKRLLAEIENIFFDNQQAWGQEAPEQARSCYTENFLAEYQRILHNYKKEGMRNHTKK